MRSHWPQVATVIDSANEREQQLFCVLEALHHQDTINFLGPRLETLGRQPTAKPVSLLDSTFSLEWIVCEAILFKPIKDPFKRLEMRFPSLVECLDVIKVDFSISNTKHDLFHDQLSNVRSARDSHRHPVVPALAKGCNNGETFFGGLIQFKGAELHTDVKLAEEFNPSCLERISCVFGKGQM